MTTQLNGSPTPEPFIFVPEIGWMLVPAYDALEASVPVSEPPSPRSHQAAYGVPDETKKPPQRRLRPQDPKATTTTTTTATTMAGDDAEKRARTRDTAEIRALRETLIAAALHAEAHDPPPGDTTTHRIDRLCALRIDVEILRMWPPRDPDAGGPRHSRRVGEFLRRLSRLAADAAPGDWRRYSDSCGRRIEELEKISVR